MQDLDPNQNYIIMLQGMLRKAYQELQQLQDESDLEIDSMQDIIDYQDAQLPQMYDQIMHLRSQLTSAYEQRNAALERNLQQGFTVEKAKQELDDWKRSHSDLCDMNRRLCLDLEQAEKEVADLQCQVNILMTSNAQLVDDSDRLREWARDEIRKFPPYVQRVEAAEKEAADRLSRAQVAESTAAQAISDRDWGYREIARLQKEAADARQSNNSLLDQLQAAKAKVEYFRIKHPMVYADMEQYLPGQSAPTPPTVNVDWTTAPDWANYHAFDQDGEGWWYASKPERGNNFWWKADVQAENKNTLPDGADWEQSLTQRPQQGETVPPRPMWSRYRGHG